jgi:hypothetical protein
MLVGLSATLVHVDRLQGPSRSLYAAVLRSGTDWPILTEQGNAVFVETKR